MRFRWRQTPRVRDTPAVAERPDEAFAEVLLDEGREELARADGKASILLSASGVILGALLAGVLAGTWSPTKLGDHPATEWSFWAGVAFAAVGVVLLAWAVLPRTRHNGSRETLAYFGHVVRYRERGLAIRRATRRSREARSKEELKKAVRTASAGTFDRTVDQVWTVSLIVYRKYRRIRWAMLAYAAAGILCVGAVIVNAHL